MQSSTETPTRWTIDPRTLPVRFTRLKQLDKSPLHYLQACHETNEKPSLALRMGIGTHAMMFGLPVEKFEGTRHGRKWEAFKLDHPDAVILNVTEHRRASAMVAAMHEHPLCSKILWAPGNVFEEHIDWQRQGRAKSSRVDIYNRERSIVIDYKTTRDATLKNFQRDAWRMFYPAQLQYYRDAIYAKHGWMPRTAMIIAQESKAPFDVVPFVIKLETLEISAITIAKWEATLAECEAANIWPGISSGIVEFEPPNQNEYVIDASDDDVAIEGSFV